MAFGGVGCHFMANWMNRNVKIYTHMGAEGAQWIGQAPFVSTDHVFQQLGDGTYFHSGSLGIRAAVSAGVNITYKILFNDAVAMTGGQPVDGLLTVPMITHQVHQEGAKKTVIVTDEPEKYSGVRDLAPGATVRHRRELDAVQRELRGIKGTTVLIYDQTCAAEKRRRRKRGTFPDPAKRAVINDRVCEGCGDCSQKSNCLSVQPMDTPFGRKRMVHQSSCNKDYTCVEGLCPSFVTVHGGSVRKGSAIAQGKGVVVPEPHLKDIAPGQSFGALLAGVGGTGVITVGALLGTAAHLEGKGVSIVDQMGFAQKGGPVMTHIRIAGSQDEINTARLNSGAADLLIGFDMLTAGGPDAVKATSPTRTRAFLNLEPNMSGDFIHSPDLRYPLATLKDKFGALLSAENVDYVDATKMAVDLLGDAIGANLFMVGYAWQKGALPLQAASINRAIELNGVKSDWNMMAFEWGRMAAHDPGAVQNLIAPRSQAVRSDEELITDLAAELMQYQNAAYADRYRALVEKMRAAEAALAPGMSGLTRAVAETAFRLMAYKDEYEVARLQSSDAFRQKIEREFEGDYKLRFHLSPPIFARKDPVTGLPRKYEFGGWMMPVFRILAKMKGLRGGALDLFGYTQERRMERALIVEYFAITDQLATNLGHGNHALACEIADLPSKIRGYGHVKEKNHSDVNANLQAKMAMFMANGSASDAA